MQPVIVTGAAFVAAPVRVRTCRRSALLSSMTTIELRCEMIGVGSTGRWGFEFRAALGRARIVS